MRDAMWRLRCVHLDSGARDGQEREREVEIEGEGRMHTVEDNEARGCA